MGASTTQISRVLHERAHFLKCILFFWLHWISVAAHGLSLVAASSGYSLAALCKLLIAVASLVAEHVF